MCLDASIGLAELAKAQAGGHASWKSQLSVAGCLLLQALLAMPQAACSDFTEEVAGLPEAQLNALARDSCGAHVLQALVKVSCCGLACLACSLQT